MTSKQYLLTFILTFVLMLSVIGGVNYLIDPYAIWGNNCIESVNCRKTASGQKIYFTKAKHWQKQEAKNIILGNSRTELGINPSDIPSDFGSFYNLSIRGAPLPTNAVYLRNYLEYKNVEHVVLGIDFFSFRERPSVDSQWPPPPPTYLPMDVFGNKTPDYQTTNMQNHITALLSLQATIDSLTTVFNQEALVSHLMTNGYEHALMFEEIYKHEGARGAFNHDINQLRQKFEGVDYQLVGKNGISRSFKALEMIVNMSRDYNFKLSIFISPVHIEYLRTLKQTGHTALYLDWKSALVSFLNSQQYFENSHLYDFSGVNDFTSEAIPRSVNTPMNYWYEPAHFTPKLGKMMMQEILKKEGVKSHLLTPDNIRQRIANEKEHLTHL